MEISGPFLERTFRERRTNQKRANESTASGNWEGRSSTFLTPAPSRRTESPWTVRSSGASWWCRGSFQGARPVLAGVVASALSDVKQRRQAALALGHRPAHHSDAEAPGWALRPRLKLVPLPRREHAPDGSTLPTDSAGRPHLHRQLTRQPPLDARPVDSLTPSRRRTTTPSPRGSISPI